jgi:phospholipid transport system transporter-binding protein
MAGFTLESSAAGRYVLRGVLGFDTARLALAQGLAVLPRDTDCEFDLAGLDGGDSAGLAVLIEWLAQARARGVALRYANVPGSLRAIARLSGIEALLDGAA